MHKISQEDLEKIEKLVKEEFPEDPALQQVHIARKIIAKEAELAGLTYIQYIKSVSGKSKQKEMKKMLSIEGIYDNGQLILNESLEIKRPVKVIVTFLENIEYSTLKKSDRDIEERKNKFKELIKKVSELSKGGNSVEDIRMDRSRYNVIISKGANFYVQFKTLV